MGVAESRADKGVEIAKHLFDAAVISGATRARNRAVLIGRCADPSNVWTADHLQSDGGEPYEGVGVLTSCGSRLCPSCMAAMRRRSRKRARDVVADIKPEIGKRLRFVTLTCPTLSGVSLLDSIAIFNRAFALLNDRAFWSDRVDSAIKAVEFTVNSFGYHTHIHVAAYGSFIERDAAQEEKSKQWRAERAERLRKKRLQLVKDNLPLLGNLQDEFTHCLNTALAEHGQRVKWGANFDEGLNAYVLGPYSLLADRRHVIPDVKDGAYSLLPDDDGSIIDVHPTPAFGAGVDVRLVREKGRPSSAEVSLDHVLSEISKYMTKATSWLKVPTADLVEMAEVKRWPRCFEILGKWRNASNGDGRADGDAAPAIIVMRPGETWENFCARVAREEADPRSYALAWAELNATGRLYAATSGGDALLDTHDLSSASATSDSPDPPAKDLARDRSPSLMALGEAMSFSEWLVVVNARLAEGRRVRKSLLARKYPLARFRSLDGSQWDGITHVDDRRAERMEARCKTFERREAI